MHTKGGKPLQASRPARALILPVEVTVHTGIVLVVVREPVPHGRGYGAAKILVLDPFAILLGRTAVPGGSHSH